MRAEALQAVALWWSPSGRAPARVVILVQAAAALAGPPREGGRGPARDSAPRVWQPKAPVRSDNMSFEDMMSRFKSQSEEKMADLDHETNNRRGGGYAPRGRGGRR